MADWQAIKTEYITTDISLRKLSEKHSIRYATLQDRSKKEGWITLRDQHRTDTVSKTMSKISDKQANKMARIDCITDNLLDKLEQAVTELNITLVTNKKKTKTIEYNNSERPDKPTKEVIDEIEEIVQTATIVDRSGLKAITSALRDLKEIQMIKSELDRREQEARIDNLRKQAQKDEEQSKVIEVVFAAGPEEWNE